MSAAEHDESVRPPSPEWEFLQQLSAACAYDLPLTGLAPDDVDVDLVIAMAKGQRVLPLVVGAFAAGTLEPNAQQFDDALSAHSDELHRCLVLEAMLRDVTEALGSQGVDALLLKGIAYAHLDYPTPDARVFQDVDLLVRPEDIDQAVATLTALDFVRDLPPRSESWDRRFAKDLTFVAPSGPECDLHRTLVPGAFGFWIDLNELHRGTVALEIAGRSYRALDRPRRLVHAAYSLTIGEPSPHLGHAIDFVRIARGLTDHAEVDDLAERWRGRSLVAEAAESALRVLGEGGEAPASLVIRSLSRESANLGTPRMLRRAYRSGGGSNTLELLSAAAAIHPLRDRWSYLFRLARPSRAYRTARAASARPTEWSTALRELSSWRRR